MTIRASSLLLPILVAAPAYAVQHVEPTPLPRPDLATLVSDWHAAHGPNWRVHVALDTGYVEMLSGGRSEPRFTPQEDEDFAALARLALRDTYGMHGIEDATLELDEVMMLPLGIIGSSDKMTVRFRQVVDGVPVERGAANVLFDMSGRLLSVQATGMPKLAGFRTSPALDAARAAGRAIEWFAAETFVPATYVEEPVLVVDQYDMDGLRTPRLAWKVVVQHDGSEYQPVGKRAFVDAGTGVVYRSEESVHQFDISGTVNSLASPGVLPDIASNPPTAHPMRFMRITSGATTTYSDANGNFTLVGVNAPASVTFSVGTGTYANVVPSGGTSYSFTTTLNSATGNTVLMNSPAAATVTAQANCFRVIPLLRDFIKAVNPADTRADMQFRANTAVAGSCNAYYNGSSINFYNAGGGCSNTAYSTVIAHEHGHWMNDRYSTGNGSDGMGEGNADVWAMYMFDNPIVGQNFSGSSFIRTGTNTRQYCGDANGGCYGQVHTDGEVWMGAAWKIRNRLNASLGNTAGDLTANALFINWLNAYNQTAIHSIIETQWLTLDDDDGNINNGTPHYTDIDLGFRDQGFPGVALLAITVSGVTSLTDTTDHVGPYTVNATVVANQNPPVVSASLLYRIDGGSFTTLPMTNISGNLWRAQIPGSLTPAGIEYYVQATNSTAQTGRFPTSAPNILLGFDVGLVHVLRFHNFDGPVGDEGWTHGSIGDTSSSADDWQRESPAGKTGTGWADPASAFSTSVCWGTDMGNGTTSTTVNGAYSPNAHMYLRTPNTDCTGATNVRLRFKRWLSVQGSGSDQARLLVNGTQIYINPTSNFNDGGWTTQEYFLGALANNNPSVQVEWRIRSNGTTNYGGWNIDDVELVWIEQAPLPCPSPVNYCSSSPNSVGPGSFMSWQGSSSIANNNLELIAVGCPPNAAGLFYYGQNAVQTPFGNGFRCIGGSVFRLPIITTDFLGDGHRVLNYGALPQPISSGEQWRFQFWYRNPAAGGAGFNLSDGLLVTFCP